ncbi:MAG: DNA alkylation repair protein [Alphaproteobacteria bacterium]
MNSSPSKKVLLKDLLFNEAKLIKISQEIQAVYPDFQKNDFIIEAINKFNNLELKARISWTSQCLKKYLPSNYKDAVNILIKALPIENNPDLDDKDFGDFIYASYGEFVAKYGCDRANLELSLNALYEITKRFSAEDAIRYFINSFPQETLAQLQKWSCNKNYHVRRLSCEGTRPKLPWCQKIQIPVNLPFAILDNLYMDSKRYVTRSVANHLNDISKIDSNLVINKLREWQNSQKQNDKEMNYIINHALRSLIKAGDERAINFIGASANINLELLNFQVSKEVKINNSLDFNFELKANENALIIVDYVIYFCNKFGKIGGNKVFKIKNLNLIKGKNFYIRKSHKFRENMTTRKIYCGEHYLEIKINGKSFAKKSFIISK